MAFCQGGTFAPSPSVLSTAQGPRLRQLPIAVPGTWHLEAGEMLGIEARPFSMPNVLHH